MKNLLITFSILVLVIPFQLFAVDSLNVELVSTYADPDSCTQDLAILDNHVLIARNRCGLRILDVSDPEQPRLSGTHWLENSNYLDIEVSGNYAFIAATSGLVIIDVSDFEHPQLAFHLQLDELVTELDIVDHFAYLAGTRNGMIIVDINNPEEPNIVSEYELVRGSPLFLNVVDHYAFIETLFSGYQIVDISDPDFIVPVLTLDTRQNVYDLAASGDFLYLAGSEGIEIYDIYDIENPELMVTYAFDESCYSCFLSDNILYLANRNNGLRILDVSDFDDITEIGYYDTNGLSLDLEVRDNLIYLCDNINFGIYRYTPENDVDERHNTESPVNFTLSSPYPNPFNARTRISITLPRRSHVSLNAVDSKGSVVSNLTEGVLLPGYHQFDWCGDGVPSGTYYFILTTDNSSREVVKGMLVR